jgi:hypothetical protein
MNAAIITATVITATKHRFVPLPLTSFIDNSSIAAFAIVPDMNEEAYYMYACPHPQTWGSLRARAIVTAFAAIPEEK